MAKGLETVGSKSPRAPPVDKRVEEGEFIQEGDVRVAQLLAKAVAGCGHIGEGLDLSHFVPWPNIRAGRQRQVSIQS